MDFKKTIFLKLSLLLFLTSCSQNEASRFEFALGTFCTITLFEQGQASIYNNIFTRLNEIENLMSVNILSSDISRVNAAAGIEHIQVHEETFKVIERAVFFARLSGGAFDPSVGPLVSLWNIGKDNQQVPSRNEIEKILPLINWRNIELDKNSNSVYLKVKGMALDLGAIAKGYAADESVKIIKRSNTPRAIIDLGGNIVVLGEKKDKSLWKVGIQNPEKDRGETIGYVQIPEKTVVTSGVYERFFEENGNRYHHIFNPSNGYPAHNGLLSVTLITDVSMDADALSTAVFVLGYNEGIKLLNFFPGTEAVFIFEDKSIITTQGIDFFLTDNSFSVKQNIF